MNTEANNKLSKIFLERIKKSFSNIYYTEDEKKSLERLLLNTSVYKTNKFVELKKIGVKIHNTGLGYVASFLTAGIMVYFYGNYKNNNINDSDSIDNITLSSAGAFPADFELDGDPSYFNSVVKEILPLEQFNANIPEYLSQEYKVSDGRFFTWSGHTGVKISLLGNNRDNASLYIVKLSDKNEAKFPKEKSSKKYKVTADKAKKVKTWREGKYGYTVVQYVATTDDVNGE